ncbi:hypothetical protein GWA97_00460 [Flavobacterium sp. LaA7.5]|nr:hypothetical protein [Flavobacterium salilacus subsp. altitudinum]
MKNALLLFMLAFSAIAMAGTKEKETTKSKTNSVHTSFIYHVEDGNGETKNDTIKTKKSETSLASQISGGDGSRFDISVLIVDFINRNNIKIAKRILKD